MGRGQAGSRNVYQARCRQARGQEIRQGNRPGAKGDQIRSRQGTDRALHRVQAGSR